MKKKQSCVLDQSAKRQKRKRKERELGMFWTEDGRGKKEKGKEKSVVTWVDEKKRGGKKKEKKNSLMYTLSFLVIYPSKSHFYKC